MQAFGEKPGIRNHFRAVLRRNLEFNYVQASTCVDASSEALGMMITAAHRPLRSSMTIWVSWPLHSSKPSARARDANTSTCTPSPSATTCADPTSKSEAASMEPSWSSWPLWALKLSSSLQRLAKRVASHFGQTHSMSVAHHGCLQVYLRCPIPLDISWPCRTRRSAALSRARRQVRSLRPPRTSLLFD